MMMMMMKVVAVVVVMMMVGVVESALSHFSFCCFCSCNSFRGGLRSHGGGYDGKMMFLHRSRFYDVLRLLPGLLWCCGRY